MVDFSTMGSVLAGAFFSERAQIYSKGTPTVNAHGDRLPGTPVLEGSIACDMQAYSKELAQRDYGFTEDVTRRMYCSASALIALGRYVKHGNDWYVISAIPEDTEVCAVLLRGCDPLD